MTSIVDQNTLVPDEMRRDISARCPSTMDGLQCELIRRHDGLHAAEITRDENGNVDGAVTWKNAPAPSEALGEHLEDPRDDKAEGIVAIASAIPVSNLPDDQLLMRREFLLAQRRQVLDAISAQVSEIEAEVEVRVERNGGRALLAHQEGLIVKAEMHDQFTQWVYDVVGLREVSKLLPEKEAAKIVKHVEEQVTVVAAHDEPGNSRSIEALINQYGEQSEIGKRLAACRQHSPLGKKLKITAEAAR